MTREAVCPSPANLSRKQQHDRACHNVVCFIAGFAGQSSNVSTNYLIQCLGQHVDKAMEVQVLRPGVGSVSLQVTVSEALQ